jgi:hypothetical protein
MGGEHNGAVLLGSFYYIPNMTSRNRIHASGGLIKVQDLRIPYQRYRDRKSSFHSAAKCACGFGLTLALACGGEQYLTIMISLN